MANVLAKIIAIAAGESVGKNAKACYSLTTFLLFNRKLGCFEITYLF